MASIRDAADSVQSAIDFGELAAQRAPGGHPIFDALTRARSELADLEAAIPWYSTTGGDVPAYAERAAQRAVDDIFAAAADIRTDPDAPLARTTYQKEKPFPWAWVLAGVGVTVLAAAYLHKRAYG